MIPRTLRGGSHGEVEEAHEHGRPTSLGPNGEPEEH